MPFRKRKAEKKKDLICSACDYATDKPPNGCRHIARKHVPGVYLFKDSIRPGEQPQYFWPRPQDFLKYSPFFKKKRQQSGNNNSHSGEDFTDSMWDIMGAWTKKMETIERFLKYVSGPQQQQPFPPFSFSMPYSTAGGFAPWSSSGSRSGNNDALPADAKPLSGATGTTVVVGLFLGRCPKCGSTEPVELREHNNNNNNNNASKEKFFKHLCTHNAAIIAEDKDAKVLGLVAGIKRWARSSKIVIEAEKINWLNAGTHHAINWIEPGDNKYGWLAGFLMSNHGQAVVLNDYYLAQFLALTKRTQAIVAIKRGTAIGVPHGDYFTVAVRPLAHTLTS